MAKDSLVSSCIGFLKTTLDDNVVLMMPSYRQFTHLQSFYISTKTIQALPAVFFFLLLLLKTFPVFPPSCPAGMKLNDNFNFRKQIVGNLRLTDTDFSFIFSRLATHFIFRAPSLPSHAQTRGDGGGKIDKKTCKMEMFQANIQLLVKVAQRSQFRRRNVELLI